MLGFVNDGEVPVKILVDRDNDVFLREYVDPGRPFLHALVSFVQAFLIVELLVEERTEDVNLFCKIRVFLLNISKPKLQAELYQCIIEELVRSEPVQIAAHNVQCTRARWGVYEN